MFSLVRYLYRPMSFDEGTYVRFKTLNHRISPPKGSEDQYSGLYKLTGSEIIDLGIYLDNPKSHWNSLPLRWRPLSN